MSDLSVQRHKRTLEAGVLGVWSSTGRRPANSATAEAMARGAVHEVLSALRHNPAWARSLGIGGDQ